MQETLKLVQSWLSDYGYAAVVPALLFDATGVPWAWVILLLLAEESRLNVPLLLGMGFLTLSLWDHGCYWLGALIGKRGMDKLGRRFPALDNAVTSAANAVSQRGFLAVVGGRFLPLMGRFIGLGASLSQMSYVRFALLDAVGVSITVLAFGWSAHLLGRQVVDDPRFATFLNWAIWTGVVAFVLWLLHRAWLALQARDARRTLEAHDPARTDGA